MRTYSRKSEVSNSSFKDIQHPHVNRQGQTDVLPREPKKYWQVSAHCETIPFSQPWPEVQFDSPATNYHYQRLSAAGVPDQQKAKFVTQAHNRVLTKLIQSQLQVKNFILPVQLMKMKFMDPFSRQRVIEKLSDYFSFQMGLRSIVLEQAEIKFPDLCLVLLAIAENSKVRSLFLWHVLDPCDKPFQGPLQSEIVLDDLPRIPYTYNPGGRKYLRDLNIAKGQNQSSTTVENGRTLTKETTKSHVINHDASSIFRKGSTESHLEYADSNIILHLRKRENMIKKSFLHLSDNTTGHIIKTEFVPIIPEDEEHVFSQADVGIQCSITDLKGHATDKNGGHIHHVPPCDEKLETQSEQNFRKLRTTQLHFCKNYLKYYKNTKIRINVLRDIYMVALASLTNLTQLAVNYCMLADGTGSTLLSIGSIMNGRLKQLKLLCEPDDIPSPTHQVYDGKALQTIPDIVWHKVRQECPQLKVNIVCVSMSAYDVTKRFVTKHMPLNSFHMENGFGPTLSCPQLTIYCTLKCLWLNHADTLEHINLTLWHTTGRIDSSLEQLIQKVNLRSFVYSGPLQYKTTVKKLCEAAHKSDSIKHFKLMIQCDPCSPHNAQELTNDVYHQYRLKFQHKSVHFVLGIFSA